MSLIKAEVIKTVRDLCIKNNKIPYIRILYTEEISELESYISDGFFVILSISKSAVLHLNITNDYIALDITIKQVPVQVKIPLKLIMSIFPKENPEEGVNFHINTDPKFLYEKSLDEVKKEGSKKFTLSIVK